MTIRRGGKQQIAVVVYPGLSALEMVGTARPKRLTRHERAGDVPAS